MKGAGERVVVTPAGQRVAQTRGASSLLELDEQGVYEIRTGSSSATRGPTFAVNLDPAEAELTPLDPKELVATVTGRASDAAAVQPTAAAEMTREESEKRQGIWWYLLLAGLLLLAAETVVSNRLSQHERFL